MIDKIIKISFVILIFSILLSGLLFFDFTREVSKKENRTLAKFPKRSPFHEEFPKEIDEWVNDRVGFRELSIDLYSNYYETNQLLDMQKTAIIGRDNWLFYNAESDDIKNFQGITNISNDKLDIFYSHIERLKKFCDENNIKFYLLIPPNKSSVYFEYYPKYIRRLDKPFNYEIILNYLKNKDINFPLFYEDYLKEKNKEYLYYKGDTHWTSVGAYIAYYRLGQMIKKDFPNFKLIEKDDIKYDSKTRKNGDLVNMLRISDFEEQVNEIVIKSPYNIETTMDKDETDKFFYTKSENNNGLKVIVFGDSFFTVNMKEFLYQSVSEVKHIRFYLKSPLIYKDEILEFKPDILIYEVLERHTLNISNGNYSYD